MVTQRYLLRVWYLGTQFSGSQRQPHVRTVEGELLRTLSTLGYISQLDQQKFHAATRTDAGVHARETFFAVTTDKPFYLHEVDDRLPNDMGISGWAEVPLEFHPRFDTHWKEYQYFYPITINSVFDIPLITHGLEILQGTHEFRQFSKTDRTKSEQRTRITLDTATLLPTPDALIFTFRSQGFLWQQVRRMVTFLLKLGQHEASLDELRYKLSEKARDDPDIKRDPPISAAGLILWQIEYPNQIPINTDAKSQARYISAWRSFWQEHNQLSEIGKYLSDHGH